jgi:hypothetical protein
MSNNGEMASYQEQKASKPAPEDIIQKSLNDDKKEGALDFVAYVKSLRMNPQWASTNSWTLNYKNKRVGYFRINESTGDWQVSIHSQYDEYFNELVSGESKDIQDFILNNITYCYKCSACTPGIDMVLLGKDLKKICATPGIRLENPDETYRDFAKKLIMLRREAIASDRVPKVTYIAIKNRK